MKRPSDIIRMQCNTSFMLSSVRSFTCDPYQCLISCNMLLKLCDFIYSTLHYDLSCWLCCRWGAGWSSGAEHQGQVCRLPRQSRAAEGISEEEGEESSGQACQRVAVWWQRVRLINKTVEWVNIPVFVAVVTCLNSGSWRPFSTLYLGKVCCKGLVIF